MFQIDRTLTKIRTFVRLGLANLLRVGIYRILVKSGFYKVFLPIARQISGPFFTRINTTPVGDVAFTDMAVWSSDADRILSGQLKIFSDRWVSTGFPPRWHRNVISQVDLTDNDKHWSGISDFDLAGGDIKGFWEPSRFDGLLVLAIAFAGTCTEKYLQAIEQWLADWSRHNPANAGVNWKCGQETALRLMQTLLTVDLFDRKQLAKPTRAFCQWVVEHCERIGPTMMYAVAQDNNHGTSEAAALMLGGLFIRRFGNTLDQKAGERWERIGRLRLEERLHRLVLTDGSFSQNSINYHRLLLDTCVIAEVIRDNWGAPPLANDFYAACARATTWLADMTDPTTGEAPNLGANDGARLLGFQRLPYSDFRSTVQTAASIFLRRRYYAEGDHDEPLRWLASSDRVDEMAQPHFESKLWREGGYAKLAVPRAWLLLRLPHFKFRPSQSDALHLDLWINGENILCDGGTFSYNAESRWCEYFSGVESHNTVQFDRRDQMPRLSRFLFGDWLECRELQFIAAESKISAAYRDSRGAEHKRTVELTAANRCTVIDEIGGFSDSAVLRWRLQPRTEWTIAAGVCCSAQFRMSIQSSAPIVRFDKIEGWQSRTYGTKSSLPVLEVEVDRAATIVTEMNWST